ncbi:MAG: nucleotide exchange factor GrpE [Coriobacteriales bacterium]|jgi:molecular chaperone GrpE|nr:nucleotide exchange factor GrpE [Coriobacteriales bacterium]
MAARKTPGPGARGADAFFEVGPLAGPGEAEAVEAAWAAKEATEGAAATDVADSGAASADGPSEEPCGAGQGAAEAQPGTEGQTDPLAQAQAEAQDLRDRLARLQAEWDNFRKRTAAERAQERARATERLVERLLPIVDDLERAAAHSGTADAASLREGIAAVHAKLSEAFEREGVQTIDPKGEPFDANLHQAVGKEEDASVPDETVTQVYQKGYGMGDRVLRSAMVVVSQGGPRREAQEEGTEETR